MRVKIYQINSDRDSNRVRLFGYDSLQKFQGSSDVDSSIYDTTPTYMFSHLFYVHKFLLEWV